MPKVIPALSLLLSSLAIAANAAAQNDTDRAPNCAGFGGLEFVCGPLNAEDLVQVPGEPWIIASGMTEGAALFLIDSRDKTWSELYPGEAPRSEPDLDAFGNCPGAPTQLVAHGLSIRPGERGRSRLYVVGHGGREAIEVFEVDARGAEPAVTWVGCVPMPEGLEANSVASFEDGSLVATVLVLPGKTFTDQLAGKPTGAVYEWSPGEGGFELVRGTELPGNNGIEVSEDGAEFFVVSSGLHTVTAFARTNPTRPLRTTRPLPFTPDNLHRDPDGRLLTAGMKDDEPACGGAPGPQHDLSQLATCPRGYMAVAIDPQTMQDTVLAEGPPNPDFSNFTMVLVMDEEFWIGTFSGDRIGYGTLE